ncbi:Xaa-Pro dipeptidyl-peptidase [Oenococcus oeni]|nr:Xaa-Pro dipeptidyl-peptidase [Oenococcus oeni]TEU60170.1 Xaa-Pro dipeptidyl-peptidase [Oenococcus oeni]TEU61966.1 Xaa-Pro dipeptidyl-peptidase [Oenococcus oeni]
MKNNFKYNAFTDDSFFDPFDELKRINLFDDSFFENSFHDNLKIFFKRMFPNCHSFEAKKEAEKAILVNEKNDLSTYLERDFQSISAEDFYLVIDQLLDFNLGLEIDFGSGKQFLIDSGQQVLSAVKIDSTNLADFLFNALILRSANGLSLIDNLVSDGFLIESFADKIPKPLFFAGKSLAVFQKKDLLHERVYIDTRIDTDQDQKNDLLLLTISRPKKEVADFKVPVILTTNPYFYGTNDMQEDVHSPEGDLSVKDDFNFQIGSSSEAEKQLPALKKQEVIEEESFKRSSKTGASTFPLNDYFLARGFAVAYYGGLGTRGSDGLRSSGGPDETTACCAAIEYLSGHRLAFTDKTASNSIRAAWSNGSVAMTGRSYLGTLATACATRNPLGLKTIISESAISSWYDYYRENGLVVAPGGFQGEDADVLALDTFSRWFDGSQFFKIKSIFEKSLSEMKKAEDRQTGNYNEFWDQRNYLNQAEKIKIDCLYVHGLNDWNVKPINVFNILTKLSKHSGQSVNVILHQGQHISPHDIRSFDYLDICNAWLTHELFGLENYIQKTLPKVIVEDNIDPEIWHGQSDWTQTERKSEFNLAKLAGEKLASYKDNLTEIYHNHYSSYENYEKDFYSAKEIFDNSLLKINLPTIADSTINGRIQLNLRIKTNSRTGLLTAALVEMNAGKHSSKVTKIVLNRNFKINFEDHAIPLRDFYSKRTDEHLITNGHINLQNIQGPNIVNQVYENQFLDLKLLLQPTIYRLTAASKIVLFIFASDMQYTLHPQKIQEYTVDLKESKIILPIL